MLNDQKVNSLKNSSGFLNPQKREKSTLKESATLSKMVACSGMKGGNSWERKTWPSTVLALPIAITDLLRQARPGPWRDASCVWEYYARFLSLEKWKYLVLPWLHLIVNIILINLCFLVLFYHVDFSFHCSFEEGSTSMKF